MNESELAGIIANDKHKIVLQTYYEQGGGIEDYVAWCKVCDPEGFNTITIDIRLLGGTVEAMDELMMLVASHLNLG